MRIDTFKGLKILCNWKFKYKITVYLTATLYNILTSANAVNIVYYIL
jgi:hypothetical protein